MANKLKVFLIAELVALSSIAIVVTASNGTSNNIARITATGNDYNLTLNSSNAPSGLTTSYQRTVSSTVTTNLGNELTIVATNAKALNGGYVQLGNYGTVYCITDNDKHISGLTSLTATFSGSLKLLASSVDTISEGSSYINEEKDVTSGSIVNLTTAANSFVLRAGEGGAEITSISMNYTCATSDSSYTFNKVYDVEDFEAYTATGVGYDSSHGMNAATNLRAAYYSTYYGAGTNPVSGTGWTIMGSSDYLTYNANKGVNDSKCALFKSNNGNYFHYLQSKHFFGVPSAIGKGARLSVMMRGAYTSTEASANSTLDATVTLIAYYNKILNKSGTNEAATATYTVPAGSGWQEYVVDLDPTKTVYSYGIHIAKAGGTIYVPVDNVKIYTTSPYGNVDVTGISLNSTSANLTIGETKTLTATVAPANATNKSVTWTSNNPSVATVIDGVVTAVTAGNATITATTNDGGFTATCTITVTKTYPGGTFIGETKANGTEIKIELYSHPSGRVRLFMIGTEMTEVTQYTSYNENTHYFSIYIPGGYNALITTLSYGNLEGTFENGKMTGVHLTGDIAGYLSNNNIELTPPSSTYWDCEGDTLALQNTFKRRFDRGSGMETDTTNGDRITADTVHYVSGSTGVKWRPYSGGTVAITLQNDINPSVSRNTISFWVYNPSNSDVTLDMYYYKGTGNSSSGGITSGKVFAPGWTHFRCGFTSNNIYNFQVVDAHRSGVALTFDDFYLF